MGTGIAGSKFDSGSGAVRRLLVAKMEGIGGFFGSGGRIGGVVPSN